MKKTISSVDYWVSVGLYLSMVEVMKVFNDCQAKLLKRFSFNERLAETIIDASTERGSDKGTFDMILKENDIVVFDEPVVSKKETDEQESDISIPAG